MMNVAILTPQKIVFQTKQALLVSIEGGDPPFQILKNHAPIVSIIHGKKIIIKEEKKHTTYLVNHGVVRTKNNQVDILVDSAQPI